MSHWTSIARCTTRYTPTTPRDDGAEVHDPAMADASIRAYLFQQTPDKRALLEKLGVLVEKAIPDATASIKWGVPV